MQELDILNKFKEIECIPFQSEEEGKLERHKKWLSTIVREYPSPQKSFNIGVYIRYFNQTKYENYLEYHKRQFADTINARLGEIPIKQVLCVGKGRGGGALGVAEAMVLAYNGKKKSSINKLLIQKMYAKN